MTPSPSELEFASFLTYCPRGDTKEIKRSQDLVRQLKENRFVRMGERYEEAASLVARRLRETSPSFVDEFLGPDRALVPVPRSARRKGAALWPAQEIADSLRAEGFGMQVLPCLERKTAVPKAATTDAAKRPKARDHVESLGLRDPLALPARLTLVDDVITRGAQLFGAAWRIWRARPDIDVRAFVVIRTISAAKDFVSISAPCTGRIKWRDEQCYRRP